MMAAEGAGAELAFAPKDKRLVAPDRSLTRAFDDAYERFKSTQSALGELA